MKPTLREYQQDCVVAILADWASGIQRPAVLLPTGTGKTVAFAALCSLCRRRGDRPLILVNRDELVEQAVAKLRAADPMLAVGVIRGSDNDLRADVTVASVQTLSRVARLHKIDMNRFNVIICDEAHYAAADSWRRVLEYFGGFKPDSGCRVVGFTATMVRTDKRGLGEIWDRVCFEKDIRWAINRGFLVPPQAKTVIIPALAMDKIKTSHGDFSDGDLGRAMAQAKAGPLVAAAYREHCMRDGELRRGIVFTPTIALAQSFLRDFRAVGIPTELVIGSTPRAERQAAYRRTDTGENRVLMSVGVLTTGFDLPAVEVAVIARPTKSPGLYVQMVGRVLRPNEATGKTDAMILDVVGASRLGLASIVDLQLDKLQDDEVIELDELDEDGLPMIVPRFLIDAPDEIGWQDVNPFDGTSFMGPPPKIVKVKKRRTGPWNMTNAGIAFLEPDGHRHFEDLVFVWQSDGGYTVGVKKRRKKAERKDRFATLAEAVAAAELLHPCADPRWRRTQMTGSVSEGQARILNQFRVDYDAFTLTKSEASHMINVLFASAELDGS